MSEREHMPFGKMKAAAFIATEIVAPTAIAEVLRSKRGSNLALSPEDSGELTKLEAVGGVTIFMASPTLGSTFYALGKLLEFHYLRKK
ncbi:MAG: hypothetical protein H0W89_07195 [Candidatus Levybacteria bacterium]|nr:hypothetical protein [Candidatus Levybacteria bacterium]